MSNEKNYDLIHIDPGVKIKRIYGVLTVSGSGHCELGDVRGDFSLTDGVEVTAERVGGDVRSYAQSTLTARTVEGD